jgi:hypothetical protein
MPPNKALQLPSHSAFQSTSDRLWHCNPGASGEPRRRCGSQLSARSVGQHPREEIASESRCEPRATFREAHARYSRASASPSACPALTPRQLLPSFVLARERRSHEVGCFASAGSARSGFARNGSTRGQATSTGRCRSRPQRSWDRGPGRPAVGTSRRAAASQGLANKRLQLTCESSAGSIRGSVWRRTARRAAGGQRLSHAAEP